MLKIISIILLRFILVLLVDTNAFPMGNVIANGYTPCIIADSYLTGLLLIV